MILSSSDILEALEKGLEIEGYDVGNLNPNSYDLTLSPKLLSYIDPVIDLKRKASSSEVDIGDDGILLYPNKLYIGSSNERLNVPTSLVPIVFGKSSLGRLGIEVTAGSGFGDAGFKGNWSFQIRVTQPTRLYKNIKIAQVAFFKVNSESDGYSGKYQNSIGPQISKSFKDWA